MRSERGIALVLVLTVILALAIIATPFVLSMTRQERTATAERAEQQAYFGSEGVRNYGAAVALRGVDHYERRSPVGPWSTPYRDVPQEFSIDLRNSRLQSLGVLDPVGKIWGVIGEDEQGKMNIRTTPERALRALRTWVDADIIDIKDYTTQYSARDAHWVFPQRVRAVGQFQLPGGKMVDGVRVDNVVHFGREARVRFSRPGMTSSMITKVRRNYLISDGVHVFEPEEMPPSNVQVVEVELRHPVNLNTARRETIAALLEGIRVNLGSAQLQDEISRDEAWALAVALHGQAFESLREFALWLARANVAMSKLDKLAVLANFANPVNVALDGTGTVPACFVSHDTMTLQTRSIMNAPAGTPLSTIGFREVVDLGPPVPVNWSLESQHDFDLHFVATLFAANEFAAAASIALPGSLGGYPWGNRMVTFPELFPVASSKTLKPQPVGKEAYVQLDHAPDQRGGCSYLNGGYRDHFNNEIEGQKLNGASHTYPWSNAFTSNPEKPSATPLNNAPDVAAGGMEIWVRFDQIGDVSIMDIRESDTMNRITLELIGAELVLRVTDATMDDPAKVAPIVKGFSEIRQSFVPIADTWYHFGLYWKGTRWAHLAILIDGFGDPNARFKHTTVNGQGAIGELSADLPMPTDPQDPVTPVSMDNKWLPDFPASEVNVPEPNSWPLLIGDEVIQYDKASGKAVRGERGTTVRPHPAGAKVQLFGYSSKLRPLNLSIPFPQGAVELQFNQLPVTKGATAYPFGANPTATVVGDKTDPNTGRTYIDDTQDFVPVMSPDIGEFPQKGYILIDQEVIYYDSIDVASRRFTNCERGQQGTTAARHDTGQAVWLWSIAITQTTGYLSPTVVQLEEEWIGPVQVDTTRAGFLIGVVKTQPIQLFRGVGGTQPSAHGQNEKVIPLFAVSESDVSVDRLNCQRWDYGTLINSALTRTFARIRRVSDPTSDDFIANLAGGWAGGSTPNTVQLVGLWDHVSTSYVPDDQHVRVMKWPSGELLDIQWLQTANPNVTIGPGPLTIDETKFYASPKGNFTTAAIADASQKSITMNNAGGLGQAVGAIKIGDEIVGYAEVVQNDLRSLRRGWLNSRAHVHAPGELAFNLSFLPITKLAKDIGPDDSGIEVEGAMRGVNYASGYMLIDQEVIGFEAIRTPGITYDTFEDFQRLALWRGRFGTSRRSHGTGQLVYGIPFRYWDTYRPQQFDNRMAYYHAAITRRGARWRTVRWDEDMPAKDPLLRTHLLVRADGIGEMYDVPVQDQRVLLWEFLRPGIANTLDYSSGMRDAGQLDVRFMVEYLPNAYWPQNAWKRSPRIRQLTVEYERPTKVVFHEED